MDEQTPPARTPKVAYIVTLAQDSKDPEAAETLVLVPAETRAKAHLVAQQQCRERQGWLRPRIIDSLRLPGEAADEPDARIFYLPRGRILMTAPFATLSSILEEP